ncbi:transporter substrate-binding domain-containing protein [Paracidovorax cattleyae]|uniref:Cyclohexadienyl dehydratase n=1 Tax=Paracidovorax cattleyae TaxID=80868 RepID=A0A1H0VEN5_9BURK|nr:transporter substrate-binding domain-containing protein [Paracidovorax cattleyae]AVS74702.1 cyclohexadienyl dehydratase [Paracidovorax cattleyae]MBF9264212.1 transporter substrate-binding domain-containing protein [Paracidovorax cattleyae]SDP76783.1 cyclohexadienyl dehydratase [Paracidovorax cattleyae]
MKRMSASTLIATAALTAAACIQAAHAGPRLDRIMDTKVLRVGTPGDYRPFAIKADGGGYAGHDIDVVETMAKELGVKIDYVPTTWPNLMKDIQADKFDVAVGGITRNVTRIRQIEMLPGYAPFGKVALVRAADKDRFRTLADLNRPGVRVIKNPGGTNETFVLESLKAAEVSTHDRNAEIPALIAEGKGDVMITETYEALYYAKADPRLYAAFVAAPLTPQNTLGFMLPKDDADYSRVMEFVWGLMDARGQLRQAADKWLK